MTNDNFHESQQDLMNCLRIFHSCRTGLRRGSEVETSVDGTEKRKWRTSRSRRSTKRVAPCLPRLPALFHSSTQLKYLLAHREFEKATYNPTGLYLAYLGLTPSSILVFVMTMSMTYLAAGKQTGSKHYTVVRLKRQQAERSH